MPCHCRTEVYYLKKHDMDIKNYQTKIADLTVAEFASLIRDVITNEKLNNQNEYVFGLYGLANMLGISMPTAQRLKNTGVLDEAISYAGRKMVINKQIALDKLRVRRQK